MFGARELCHLGVEVPEGECDLTVGEETHEWRNGKVTRGGCSYNLTILPSYHLTTVGNLLEPIVFGRQVHRPTSTSPTLRLATLRLATDGRPHGHEAGSRAA